MADGGLEVVTGNCELPPLLPPAAPVPPAPTGGAGEGPVELPPELPPVDEGEVADAELLEERFFV